MISATINGLFYIQYGSSRPLDECISIGVTSQTKVYTLVFSFGRVTNDLTVSICVLDSPYRHALITSLLTLQENGKLTQLKKKWWKEKRGGGACEVCLSADNVYGFIV